MAEEISMKTALNELKITISNSSNPDKIQEIASEYKVNVDGLEFPVRAKIYKSVTSKLYEATFSHTYRKSGAASNYAPTNPHNTLDSVTYDVIEYLNSFENLHVKENADY
jgi:hypothetical protein